MAAGKDESFAKVGEAGYQAGQETSHTRPAMGAYRGQMEER